MGDLKLVTIGAGVVIKDGKILLIKRVSPPYAGYWAIPGGKIEPGEHVEECVIREIKEETNLDCEVESLSGIASEIMYNKETKEKKAHFLVFVLKLKAKHLDVVETDEGELKWFDIEDLNNIRIIPSDLLMIKEFVLKEKKMEVNRIKMIEDGDVYEVEEFV